MKNTLTLNVSEIINNTEATSTEDGEIVFEKIKKAFDNSIKVELDFKNIENAITAFFNAAIGQLYSQYSSEFIDKYLTYINFEDEDLQIMLEDSKQTAIKWFKNPQVYEKNLQEAMEND